MTMARWLFLLAALLWPALLMAQAQTLPQVRVLATGGTIAGVGSANSSSYRAGMVKVDDLLASAPGAAQIATLSAEQIANIGSTDMDEAVWRRLHARTLAALAEPGMAGVVITHGTDTIEETAYLFSLILQPQKPVVLVGSMRPSTAVSADGPANLLDAIRVASAASAAGRGVMLVMNDQIFDPRSVTKVDVRQVNGFAAPARGPIGHVQQPQPRFFFPAAGRAPQLALLPKPLPRVAILYAYAGMTGDDVNNVAKGADGLIVAGAGAGGVSSSARKAINALAKRGLPVVRTPRQGIGDIWPAEPPSTTKRDDDDDDRVPTIAGRELNPAKARILLMLALQQPRTVAELQALFNDLGTSEAR
jgi:L-asparaginase